MRGIIVGSGRIDDCAFYKSLFNAEDLIICADGGARYLIEMGICPGVLLGDFDSIEEDNLRYFEKQGVEIIKFPAEKDMTDTELAIEYATGMGCESIVMIGGIGNRMDHTLSNVFLLKKMFDMGIKGRIIDESNDITLISDKITISGSSETKITLLPLTPEVGGITTTGLYYPLDKALICMGSTRGVSNQLTGDTAEICIESGLLLVIKARD